MDKYTKTRLLVVDVVFFMSMFLKTCIFSLKADTITEDSVLSGDSTIVSAQRVFELGFFQPGPSPNYYIGIWYFSTRFSNCWNFLGYLFTFFFWIDFIKIFSSPHLPEPNILYVSILAVSFLIYLLFF